MKKVEDKILALSWHKCFFFFFFNTYISNFFQIRTNWNSLQVTQLSEAYLDNCDYLLVKVEFFISNDTEISALGHCAFLYFIQTD